MTLFPNCKINIGLRVVSKREDGYHNLETIFYPVMGLHDELQVEVADNFEFIQEGLAVDCPAEDNLIIKCYQNMRAKYPQVGNVRIRFKKNIPFGAGLGGGSSDAAHMAIALNELFALELTQEQMAADVRLLGADCPFFIYNKPCIAEGIGDIFSPTQLSLIGSRLVLIKPNIHVSTKEAYGGIHLHPEAKGSLKNITKPNHLAINDFEQTIFAIHPELNHIKQQLLKAGAYYAAMSGSGSTIFGLFHGDSECGTNTHLRGFDKQLASMIIFNDTL